MAAIDSAFELIRDNYDIVQDWFDVQGRKGKKFAKHFDGRTKPRIKCKDIKVDARGVPTGMELATRLLDGHATRRGISAGDAHTCLDIDLAAVLLHEVHHLCWRGGERTAWSLEAWWRAKVTDRLGLGGATYCNHPVGEFPPNGKYRLPLRDIKVLVKDYRETA